MIGKYIFTDGILLLPNIKLEGIVVKVSGSRVYYVETAKVYIEKHKMYVPLPRPTLLKEEHDGYVSLKSVKLVADNYEEALFHHIENKKIQLFMAGLIKSLGETISQGSYGKNYNELKHRHFKDFDEFSKLYSVNDKQKLLDIYTKMVEAGAHIRINEPLSLDCLDQTIF